VAAAAVLSSAVTWWATSGAGGSRGDPMGELVASHVRSLQVDHLTDIASSDRHAVKPWFAGKLDFTPPVADLAAEGYALRGGRLDYVDGRQVAALAYQRRQHVINLFVWPDAGGDEAARATQRAGFNVVAWRERGLRFALVSDLGEDELRGFAERLRVP
jgi:anti-sigma factor RsiW